MNNFFTPLLAFLLLCQTLAAQTDTVPPFLRCKSNVELQLGPVCIATVWPTDLIDSLSDNAPGFISTRLRKRCTGSGYPESGTTISFIGNDMGDNNFAEIWAQDLAGNTSSCMVQITVADFKGNCHGGFYLRTALPDNTGIAGVTFNLSGQNCLGDTIPANKVSYIITYTSGEWNEFGSSLESGYTSTLTPVKKTNPLNGVSTFDLVTIQRHILGVEPFDAPWKHVAADANLDGKVTLQDVVLLQKLILGLIPELPHGQSWRFYPKDHVFQDPANPLLPVPPQAIVVPASTEPLPTFFQFTGVKIGDVTGNADSKL